MHFSLSIIPFSSIIFFLSWRGPHMQDEDTPWSSTAVWEILLCSLLLFCGRNNCFWDGVGRRRRMMREWIFLVPCCLRWLQHSLFPHGIVDLIYIYEHFWDNQSIIIFIYISAYSHIHLINSPSICLKEMIHCRSWNSGSIKQQPSFWELIIQRLQFGIILLLRCYSCNPNEFCLSSYVYAKALVSLLITNASWGEMPNWKALSI